LPKQSGSDAHGAQLSAMGGIVLEKRAKDIQDIIAAIKERRVTLIQE